MAALEGVENDADQLAPLITLKPPGMPDPPDVEAEVEPRFLEPRLVDTATQPPHAYIDAVGEQIGAIAFGEGRLALGRPLPFVYCDTAEADDYFDTSRMRQLLGRICGPAVPVWRSRTPESRLAEALRLGGDGRGIAARVQIGDLVTQQALPASLRLTADHVDLILDLSEDVQTMSTVPSDPSWFERFMAVANDLPWRRVVLLAGGFPKTLKRLGSFQIARSCKKMQLALAEMNTGRHIIRGDYGCIYPKLITLHSGRHHPNLRYASDDSWIVHRADPAPPGEKSPYWSLSRDCIDHQSFKSPKYSVGDRAIYETAKGRWPPGWAKSALARALSHHLRLATLEAQLGT